jgi:hypothetical protein
MLQKQMYKDTEKVLAIECISIARTARTTVSSYTCVDQCNHETSGRLS